MLNKNSLMNSLFHCTFCVTADETSSPPKLALPGDFARFVLSFRGRRRAGRDVTTVQTVGTKQNINTLQKAM